jgi:molybdenum cofactor cytidylyltransferase
MLTKTNALITAAGFSGRMGTHKALLKFDNNHNFLEKLIENYTLIGCKEIIVTANSDLFKSIESYQNNSVKIIENIHPEYERLYSIIIGLNAMSYSDFCFIQSIDNPFVKAETLSMLSDQSNFQTIIKPVFNNKGGHPIIINKFIIDYLKNYKVLLLKLNEILKIFPKLEVETDDESVLYNINTQEDYEKAMKTI